ncbi:DUF1128 domain-containing protein [Paludifilum halophilum]|nr:DUF1128 family protein [Paludifilum halophilum]
MHLEKPSRENLDFMINELKAHLKLVNTSIIKPEDYHLDDYEEVHDLYKMVEKKEGRLTMMELEGILKELGQLRQTD